MMEEGEFSVLFHSYRELREAVAVNGFYSLDHSNFHIQVA